MVISIKFFLLISVLLLYRFVFDTILIGEIVKYIIFSLGVTNVIIILLYMNIPIIIKYIVYMGWVSIILFMWSYYYIMGAWLLNPDTIMAVLQSNPNEIKEYIYGHLSIYHFCILAGIYFVFYLILFNLKIKIGLNKNIIICFFYSLMMIFLGRESIFINAYDDVNRYMNYYSDFKLKCEERANSVSSINLDNSINQNNGVFVLVIGESQNKNHMSAYGYTRETTPWLREKLGDDNFVIFDNAYSCHTHTVPSLSYALTAKNQYNEVRFQEAVSLVEVAKSAGFKVIWISNQSKFGVNDTPITVIASGADEQYWINDETSGKVRTKMYDFELVNYIKNIKFSGNTLVIFHLMGNHSTYEERYPNNFKIFKNDNFIDAYDNSIIYNDYVVSNIHAAFEKFDNFNGMIYFSDHSEDVINFLGHDSNRFTFDMIEIPLYVFLSDKFIDKNHGLLNNLKSHKSEYITNDLVFNLVLSLMGVRVEGLYEPENDILSDQYDKDKSRFKTMYGRRCLSE